MLTSNATSNSTSLFFQFDREKVELKKTKKKRNEMEISARQPRGEMITGSEGGNRGGEGGGKSGGGGKKKGRKGKKGGSGDSGSGEEDDEEEEEDDDEGKMDLNEWTTGHL